MTSRSSLALPMAQDPPRALAAHLVAWMQLPGVDRNPCQNCQWRRASCSLRAGLRGS